MKIYKIKEYCIKDLNISTSLRNPIKGGNPIFKIQSMKIIKINTLEKEINFTTIKERVFHQLKRPTNQNIKGEIKP